jgi:hypothetical protein
MTELFQVHLVGEEGELWAHTHGLRRLGVIELEAFGEVDDLDYVHRLVNATAAVLATNGVVPTKTALRVGEDSVVEWSPWEEFTWEDGQLGGFGDRGGRHDGPSGILAPSDAEPPLGPGLTFDESGWAVPSAAPAYEEIARQTARDAWDGARAREGRSMWVVAGGVDGTVVALEGEAFVVEAESGSRRQVPLRELEDWGVETEGGFCVGAWSAYKVPVIEDVEARWVEPRDADGTPVCADCGEPLGEGHSH